MRSRIVLEMGGLASLPQKTLPEAGSGDTFTRDVSRGHVIRI